MPGTQLNRSRGSTGPRGRKTELREPIQATDRQAAGYPRILGIGRINILRPARPSNNCGTPVLNRLPEASNTAAPCVY